MDTLQLQYYIELSKELNFTKVANHFYTTQPTVCRRMDALEEEVGVKLIKRSTHGVALTRAGKEFLRYASEIMSIYEVAGRVVRNLADDQGKILKCAAFSSSEDILMACNQVFNERHPEIHVIVDILTGKKMLDALDDSEYSFYFIHTKLVEEKREFQWIHTKRESAWLAVRETDVDKVQEQDFSRLGKCPFVCPEPIESFLLYDLFMHTCAEIGIAPPILNYYSRASSALLSVKMGLGNTILPTSLVKRTDNVHLFPVEKNVYLDSCIAWRRNIHTPEIDDFVEMAREKYGEL